jgi:hypothetical protein
MLISTNSRSGLTLLLWKQVLGASTCLWVDGVQSAYIIIYTGTRNLVASLFFPLRALFTCAVQPRLPPASGGRRPRFLPSGTTRVTSHMDADGGGQDAGAHVCPRQRRMFFLIISVMRRQLLLTPCFSNLPCAIFWACIVDRPMSFKNRRRDPGF